MKSQKQKQLVIKSCVLVLVFAIGVIGFLSIFADYKSVSGFITGPPESVSNAPGEGNCTACHSDFPVDSGTGSIEITGVPGNYTPGATQEITVTVTESNIVTMGFQMTVIDAQGAEAGSITLPVQNPEQLQLISGQVEGNLRRYVEHTHFGVAASGSRSWTFDWTAPLQDIGPVTFYAAGNAANSDKTTSGDFIYTTSVTSDSPANTGSAAPFDFDGDEKTDIAIFRPSVGEWWYLRSSDGGNRAFQFGTGTDNPVPADFTGDGKTDVAIFRPSLGEWFVLRSEDGSFYSFPFGTTGDIPAPGDYDGDGIADPAVFRPSTGTWFISNSSGGTTITPFGAANDLPLVGDYDNDGNTDIAIYRPSNAQYWIDRSSLGVVVYQFGQAGDRALTADFSGDGTSDPAFFRPSSGEWFILRSEDGSFFSFPFGINGDIPAPGDYDGDGIADATIFRPSTNTWFSNQSTAGTEITGFGAAGDIPVPSLTVTQ